MVLGFNELPTEDRPAEHIWLNPKALKDHWERVRSRQEARAGGQELIDDEGDSMQSPVTAGWRR